MKSSVNIRYIVNGKDAQRMWLVPSASFIVRSTEGDTTTYTPDSISCRVIKQVGGNEAEEVNSGYILKYRRNASGAGEEVQSGAIVAVHEGDEPTNTVDFSLLNSNGVEVDRFTARVIDAGANGLSPDYTVYRFKQSESRPAAPSSDSPDPPGWSDRCNNPSDTVTPWWMTMNVVSGATGQVPANGWSYPVQVTGESGTAGGYTSYAFAKNTTPYSAPSTAVVDNKHGWFDGPPELGEGEYCWMTFATFDGDDKQLTDWSAPIRITPVDSIDYVLELSCDSVQITPAVGDTPAFATPPAVSATVWKVVGGERTDVTAQSTVTYVIQSSGSGVPFSRPYSGAVTVPTYATQIDFTLYEDSTKAKAIGRKSVPVTTLVPGPPGETPDPVPGEPAVVKWIELVPSVVTRNIDGSYAPTHVTAKTMKRIGDGEAVWEDEVVEVFLGTDTDMQTPIGAAQSFDPVPLGLVVGSSHPDSLIFSSEDYGTATLVIQSLVKPGVVRCREWGVGVFRKDFLGFGDSLDTVYDYQNGVGTEYLDVVKKDKAYYMCKKSFQVILRRNEVMPEKYVPGGSGAWDIYWEQANFASFAAFDLILTEKAKVNNLYVDEVVIPETDFQGLEVPGKYAMVANSKGIHMTGTITAQAMSLDVDTPANRALLSAPLNIVDAAEIAEDSKVTLYLPCLMPGTTRQIDILVVGSSTLPQRQSYMLDLVGTQTTTGYTSRPMQRGNLDGDATCIEFSGNGLPTGGLVPNPAPTSDIFGLYRCIGYCLKTSTVTWWECIRLNDGTEAKQGFSGMATPKTSNNDSVDQVPWEPLTEGQFIKGGTIHNTISTIN